MIDAAKVAAGGKSNAETLKIEPTVLDNVSWDDAVMGEEIFGPVLPVLTYKTEEELYQIINAHQKPLALYLFTQNKGLQKRNTSGHKGVSWDKSKNKWYTYITVNYKLINLGRFSILEDAIEARKKAEIKYFGEYRSKEDDSDE